MRISSLILSKFFSWALTCLGPCSSGEAVDLTTEQFPCSTYISIIDVKHMDLLRRCNIFYPSTVPELEKTTKCSLDGNVLVLI